MKTYTNELATICAVFLEEASCAYDRTALIFRVAFGRTTKS
jgi:hypothetical protein